MQPVEAFPLNAATMITPWTTSATSPSRATQHLQRGSTVRQVDVDATRPAFNRTEPTSFH